MAHIFDGYPAWEWAIAFAFLGAGAIQAIYNLARSGSRRKRDQAIAAVCTQRGMWRVDDVRSPFLPQMLPISGAVCHNTFATPDWSLWFSEVRDRKGSSAFAVLIFGVQELNLPYIGVACKGQVDVPLGARGQTVELESIDFTNRFQIHADCRSWSAASFQRRRASPKPRTRRCTCFRTSPEHEGLTLAGELTTRTHRYAWRRR